jgi:hypothetical protein
MDEYGFLEAHEVYVTIDSSAKGRRFPASPPPGRLIVTRSPALHPGDVQFVENKVPPEGHPLLDLVHCVIFSSKGVRDVPSMLSGGDLDGDIFNIIWDDDIWAGGLRSYQPADYPRQKPVDIGRRVTIEDIANFFVDFMRTDHLGVIATRHMILADQKEKGTLDEDCLRTAALHSTAVDYSKTGVTANLQELPRCNKYRPDL